MIVFSRWEIFSWITNLAKVGYQKIGVQQREMAIVGEMKD